ncbi:MAG TPA: glycosyltransferase family 4 protein [Usitatibacter sp.]|nr:glycosyltransferase family 4 protein [Usitatibacter sp.]
MNRPVVLLLGPHRAALSGVATHVNLLMDSLLGDDFELVHFQVGSEGRDEGAIGRLLRLLFSPFALAAAIVFRHASIVHLNTSLNPRAYWRDVAYLLVAKALGARVVYQVHGGALPRRFFAGRPALTRFLRWTLGLPDLLVVLARCELEAYREFLPGRDVAMLPNAVDCRPFSLLPVVGCAEKSPLQLVYIGRLAREKGLYEALQGVRLAHELGVDARLAVAGGGPEEGRLKRYAHALGIATRVTFAGPVFGADKLRLLEGAHVSLLPSYSEGLPYALLESMAAGVPVIATAVGAIPDVMTDGIHGLLVPARDGKAIAEALAVLSGDRERISWMSRACRRRIRAAFSIDRLAAELGAHYAALCGAAVVAGAAHAAMPLAGRPEARPAQAPAKVAGRKD